MTFLQTDNPVFYEDFVYKLRKMKLYNVKIFLHVTVKCL